ncbi:MAG: 5-deoxy-glucuronate isomerase [Gaiellaceae bacterium]
MSELLLRAGKWAQVTPETAGWRHLFFGVREGAFSSETGDAEIALVPLSGRCRVDAEGESWELGGRESVFAGMPWALYLPRDTAYRAEADGEVAICGARCERRREPVLVRPEDVEVEVRGAGNATRQINHIVKPEFAAERLLVVEVFTPSGNWSSYPPHKHDEDRPPGEVVLEETYYFRTAKPEAFAVQRLYSPRHGLDVTETVRDGDLMLVPYGYHTTAAAHGYDLYYLNALAGDTRSMASADDPALHWVRGAWADLEPDPRVPLVR